MRWTQLEYPLKGMFLGLLLYAAVRSPDWRAALGVLAWLLAGVAAGVGFGLARCLRQTGPPRGGLAAYGLFVLLQSPVAVYTGTLLGVVAGALTLPRPDGDPLLAQCAGGGVVAGLALAAVRRLPRKVWRVAAGLALLAAVAGVLYGYLPHPPEGDVEAVGPRRWLGVYLLLGLPFFYLLTFVSVNEESEAEFAALCAAAAAGVWLARFPNNVPSLGLLLPVAVYVSYSTRVLPGLRVFRHTLRGYTWARQGKIRQALLAFARALTLAPNNELAVRGLAHLHSLIDLAALEGDPETLDLLDMDLCLGRASAVLSRGRPSAEGLAEARRLLELVAARRPERRPACVYWLAVADTHAGRYDEAAALLGGLLDPSAWTPADAEARQGVLLAGWRLALDAHPELTRRLGPDHLALPGRRIDAVAGAEEARAELPKDADVAALRGLFYEGVTEAEYDAAAGPTGVLPADRFDHDHARELGRALLDDPARWRRGAEYLRVAARGLTPAGRGPGVYAELAAAAERHGEPAEAERYLALARDAVPVAGSQALRPDDLAAYADAVRRLAGAAEARGDARDAVRHWLLLSAAGRADADTPRQLAALYDQLFDFLSAARYTELALAAAPKDADLLERKARYYNSLDPAEVAAAADDVKKAIDFDYCLVQGRKALDSNSDDLELVEWAERLAEVARAARPGSAAASVLLARARLRRGERDSALQLLEDVREAKPAGGDELEAWFDACKMLGLLYLNDFERADLAVGCFQDFLQSNRSGADTHYRLAQAHEATGNLRSAARHYDIVAGFREHSLAHDAEAGARRVREELSRL